MKKKPDDIYLKLKAATTLTGDGMKKIADDLGVTMVSVRMVARGYTPSKRIRAHIETYIAEHLNAEALSS